MKKILMPLWAIIIIGSLYIIQYYFKPTIPINEAQKTTTTTEKPIPTPAETPPETPTTTDNSPITAIQRALANQKIEQAKELILKLNEKEPEVAYYKSIILILYKQFDQAKEIITPLTKLEPKSDTEILIKQNAQNLFAAFESHSYYKETEIEFLELLLAKALVDNKEYYASIPLLFDILNKKSNYRDAWITLGYAYLNINKPKESIDSLKKAYDLEPSKPETLFFLGLAFAANNQNEQAISMLNAAAQSGFQPQELIQLKLKNLQTKKLSKEEQKAFYQTNLTTP